MDPLTMARIDLVRRYHAHPQGWPDGIDTKYERWYTNNQKHWDDLARGVVTEPVVKVVVTKTPAEVAKVVSNLKGGRPKSGKALSAAERKRKARAKNA